MEHKYTPGTWRKSTECGSAIVVDAPHEGTFNGAADTEFYGGYMVAESVKPVNMPVILAAPEMFAMLEKLVEKIENFIADNNRLNSVRLGMSMIEARSLLAKIQEG